MDKTPNNNQQETTQKLGMLIFESVMAVLYLALGYVFLMTPFIPMIAGVYRIIFGAVLILYGIFRVYRAIRKVSSRPKG